ncbi:MAG: hypothetical protein ACE5FT_01670 [Candidatus Nanoarchaeia archaeon]
MAEKDYSVMVAALVAVVAIVGLVVQFSGSGSTGMLPADYGAAYRHTYPTIERGTCPSGYTETDIVCTGSVIYKHEGQRLCYRTADLYCVKDAQPLGSDQAPREFGAETRFVAHEEDCVLTPPDEGGNSYYLCGG